MNAIQLHDEPPLIGPSPADQVALNLAPARADWWNAARCNDKAGTLTHLFFSDDAFDIARAKAICSKCPVAAQCLDEALANDEPWGVWGGELIENGRIVANKRPRGRPPKHPRPELVVDEVPLPPGYLKVIA
jgi:WhiB family transcriptional regulator, redox-sensing transcriptional regulator